MATKKKMLQAAAGNAGGEALNVEDVFSTYLYEGTGAARTITNGIDLAEEDGLVWLKKRSASDSHYLMNVIGSTPYFLKSNGQDAESSLPSSLFSLTNSGFNLDVFNDSGADYASWTFRNAPKFLQKIRYTGDGQNRQIPHNLGTAVGSIFVKLTSGGGSWMVWHRGLSDTTKGFLHLNETASEGGPDNDVWASTAPTDTHFSVGNSPLTNSSGKEYIAFIFAHNDGDGEFGPAGDADIIKCGSYTGNNSTNGPEIDLGFEPQWIMIKNATASQSWWMFDTMRGIVTSSNGADDAMLRADGNVAEDTQNRLHVTSTGFKLTSSSSAVNDSNTFIYIAIRRGTKVPESATEVFDAIASTASSATKLTTNFAVDLQIHKYRDGAADITVVDRLRGVSTTSTEVANYLVTSSTAAENTSSTRSLGWDNTGFKVPSWIGSLPNIFYNFRRAPNFFDAVAYTGDGTNNHVINHNLGVTPEIILLKRRDSINSWNFATQFTGSGYISGYVNSTSQLYSRTYGTGDVHYVQPTDTEFTVNNFSIVNLSGGTYIAYLFATLAGISKVGSYTGNGTSQTIDCGFTSGARFILVKRTDSTGDWYVWDTERGIVAGNDPYLLLNSRDAEVTSDDSIDPDSSGFIVNQVAATNINVSSAEYIFYAVA